MKKTFTLICMALLAMSVNAQTTEKYLAIDDDGNLAPEFANPTASGTDLIVNVSNNYVTLKAVSSKTPARTQTAGLTEDTWDSWDEAKWNKGNRGDINYNWVQGTGNPYISFQSKTVMTDGEPTGDYDPEYTYYSPDGSAGLPKSGTYAELTANADGMFKIGFWANKGGTRKLYLVKKSDKKALVWNVDPAVTEYKVEGYIAAATKSDGTLIYLTSIRVEDFVVGNTTGNYDYQDETGTAKAVAAWNQPKFGYFVFDAKKDETYMIFGSDWQFGFSGYEFTPGATISNYTAQDPTSVSAIKTAAAMADAPIYNLAGQKVDKSYKGVKIQNGKKFF